jgi:transcriptional regulator with XRE-family HTH domain
MAKRRKKKHIGELIRTRRVRLKLRAEDVAEHCNVSRARVYQWEAADYVFGKNLPALAEVLQIPLGRLRNVNGSRPA